MASPIVKSAALALFVVAASAPAAFAAPAIDTGADQCMGQVTRLDQDWWGSGLKPSPKPGGGVVHGRDSMQFPGGQVTYMLDQIRAAAAACREGNTVQASQHVNNVRAMLGYPSGMA